MAALRGVRGRLTVTIVALVALTAGLLGVASYLFVDYSLHNQFRTDAAKPSSVAVDVTLTVPLPESWGGLTGTVVDAHSGEPLPGVTVTLQSAWNGAPYVATDTTDGEGVYSLIAPEGTWPLEFALDGYVGETRDEAIEAATTREGVDASLHRNQPHASVDGGPFTFVLTEGRTATGTVTVPVVAGVLCLYLLVGLFFAFTYVAVQNLGGAPFFANGDAATSPRSLYFSFVTMTTVGYGDMVPRTDVGRALASIMMLMGWGILAVPTGIVTAEMTAQRFRPRWLSTKRCGACRSGRRRLVISTCETIPIAGRIAM